SGSATSRSPIASCSLPWRGSATGSSACRPGATAPGWRARRLSTSSRCREAGLAVSEMVSSFGLHHRNERTLRELMRIHPDEHPVSVQLFGHDAEVMRSGAAIAAEAGADLIDINMGCPVRKVRRTGAGVQLLTDPELALALTRGAIEGSGLPVTVKLRSGLRAEDRSGFDLAVRLAEEGGAAAIAFHPRAASAG